MNESIEEDDTEQRHGGAELSKANLKSLLSKEFQKEPKNQSRNASNPKREQSQNKRESSNSHSRGRKGPYLENIVAKPPLYIYSQDPHWQQHAYKQFQMPDGRPDLQKLDSFHPQAAGDHFQAQRLPDPRLYYAQMSTAGRQHENRGTIANELDEIRPGPSQLFGQKVNYHKLVAMQPPQEPDPIHSIFKRKGGESLPETDEASKQARLRSKLDALRSMVSKHGVDYYHRQLS